MDHIDEDSKLSKQDILFSVRVKIPANLEDEILANVDLSHVLKWGIQQALIALPKKITDTWTPEFREYVKLNVPSSRIYQPQEKTNYPAKSYCYDLPTSENWRMRPYYTVKMRRCEMPTSRDLRGTYPTRNDFDTLYVNPRYVVGRKTVDKLDLIEFSDHDTHLVGAVKPRKGKKVNMIWNKKGWPIGGDIQGWTDNKKEKFSLVFVPDNYKPTPKEQLEDPYYNSSLIEL